MMAKTTMVFAFAVSDTRRLARAGRSLLPHCLVPATLNEMSLLSSWIQTRDVSSLEEIKIKLEEIIKN